MANRILVVEDDTAISELICMNLEVTGYEVVPVLDGNEVEGTLEKEENFDLALLDIMLPGKDGFELLGVMKEHGIPVIYITAKADVNSKIKGLRSGAEDYIVKPFEVLELLVRVEKVLERRRQPVISDGGKLFVQLQKIFTRCQLLKLCEIRRDHLLIDIRSVFLQRKHMRDAKLFYQIRQHRPQMQHERLHPRRLRHLLHIRDLIATDAGSKPLHRPRIWQ